MRRNELSSTVWYTLLALLVIALLSFGILGIQRIIYPQWLAFQRSAVEESKSYTDATNIALANYIREYRMLETRIAEAGDNTEVIGKYREQQGAILTLMCQTMATMKEIAPTIRAFMAEKGGCR
jgi:glutaminase